MPLSNELKQNAKLARTCPKCNPRASKCKKKLGGGWSHLTPTLTWHYVPRWRLCSHLLVPAITTIVLAISNLSENPDMVYCKCFPTDTILNLPMYKLTFYSLKISPKISPKITPDLNMGQKLRSINIHEKKLIWTLDHDAASFCILTMRCLKIHEMS